ncbi:hypothetical protein VP275E431_P0063 [Vibrio phage 275E43-1]|nr:hypothetical protein VP275E431_P0063 [Vibrio phage 275E43-1]
MEIYFLGVAVSGFLTATFMGFHQWWAGDNIDDKDLSLFLTLSLFSWIGALVALLCWAVLFLSWVHGCLRKWNTREPSVLIKGRGKK